MDEFTNTNVKSVLLEDNKTDVKDRYKTYTNLLLNKKVNKFIKKYSDKKNGNRRITISREIMVIYEPLDISSDDYGLLRKIGKENNLGKFLILFQKKAKIEYDDRKEIILNIAHDFFKRDDMSISSPIPNSFKLLADEKYIDNCISFRIYAEIKISYKFNNKMVYYLVDQYDNLHQKCKDLNDALGELIKAKANNIKNHFTVYETENPEFRKYLLRYELNKIISECDIYRFIPNKINKKKHLDLWLYQQGLKNKIKILIDESNNEFISEQVMKNLQILQGLYPKSKNDIIFIANRLGVPLKNKFMISKKSLIKKLFNYPYTDDHKNELLFYL